MKPQSLILGFSLFLLGAFNAQAQSESGTATDRKDIDDLMAWIEGSWTSVENTPDGLKQIHPSCQPGNTFEVWPGGFEKGWDNPRTFDVVSIRYEQTDGKPDFLEVSYHDPLMNETESFRVQRYPPITWWLIDGEAHYVHSSDVDQLPVSQVECEEDSH